MDPITFKLQALSAFDEAQDANQLEELRVQYLGKQGLLNQLMQQVKDIPADQRAHFGRSANEAKETIQAAYEDKLKTLSASQTSNQWIDVTMPGIRPPQGHLHLVTQAIEEIADIFEKIGFVRVRYPEVEWEWFPFEALNMPKDHPARDEWETLFVDAPADPKYGKMLLTPHTSNGQVREMLRLESKPPIRMLNIAKTYRRQQDVTHSIMFNQFEGLVVDKGINITHLKGTLDYFAKTFYGPERTTRLRPFHFQFTEPSFEVDINCSICLGKGKVDGHKCRVCKQGWLELGGAGMVHPNVLKSGGIDSKEYTGFAFGWGVERVYMMRSGIKDVRDMYANDIRFLRQF